MALDVITFCSTLPFSKMPPLSSLRRYRSLDFSLYTKFWDRLWIYALDLIALIVPRQFIYSSYEKIRLVKGFVCISGAWSILALQNLTYTLLNLRTATIARLVSSAVCWLEKGFLDALLKSCYDVDWSRRYDIDRPVRNRAMRRLAKSDRTSWLTIIIITDGWAVACTEKAVHDLLWILQFY